MIFSELYSAYYNAVAAILSGILHGQHSEQELQKIVAERAFGESVLTIMTALKSEKWQLVHPDMTTALEHEPTLPLTTLQKRWLKAVSLDPRVKLFGVEFPELEDVEPLFTSADYYIYDQYNDGDPFEDPGYIKRFRCILSAIRHKRWLRIQFEGHNGVPHYWRCVPYKLEYSPKDDKFRLISANKRESLSINLGRIQQCFMLEPCEDEEYRPKPMKKRILVLELTDDRNALERAMLHFSHLDKETERIDDTHYKITLFYEKEDETELLIRVLSFGPVLNVIFPDDFVKKLCERLEKQKNMRTQT